MLSAAFAAVGGPMGDIVLLTMMQTDLPSDQIGKVYSLYMLVESAGGSIGLLLAVPLFRYLSTPVAIALCAMVMVALGVAGLTRFGFKEPAVKVV